ncbi:MAG: M23 family metallopeptidase [Spirochaetota bacterium]
MEDTLTNEQRKRLAGLERDAAREARRRAQTPPRARPPGRATDLSRRFLRATVIGALALTAVSTLVPPFLIPVEGTTSSRFFLRNAPDSRRLFAFEHHTGLDIAAVTGTRVGASRSGRVIATGDDPSYGRYVDVRHLFGTVTRYAHLSAVNVRERRLIVRGAKIGEVGMTGRATGPHLHFEVRIAGRAVPPGPLLVFHSVRRAIIGG